MQNKTIGLIGGIGWASTLEYYPLLNEMLVARIGPAHSARIMLVSMDQADFVAHAAQPDSRAIEQFLVTEGQRLQGMGADFFLLCANGAHRFAPAVVPRIGLPFISIVEETANRVRESGLRKVGLLGVKQTMAGRFYHEALEQLGIATVTPDAADQEILHDIIYTELVQNIVTDASREIFLEIIGKLRRQGAQGVILGCTEIPLLVKPGDVDLPLFNTTAIHCEAALVHDYIARGELDVVLPDWTPRTEMIHAVFATRNGMLPSTRILLDFMVEQFSTLDDAVRGMRVT